MRSVDVVGGDQVENENVEIRFNLARDFIRLRRTRYVALGNAPVFLRRVDRNPSRAFDDAVLLVGAKNDRPSVGVFRTLRELNDARFRRIARV